MEPFTTESGKYRIELLTAATFPGALRVIKDAFCQDEAVCIGSEVNKNPQAVEELLELCADAALDGVSLVAVATNNDEVVSVSFNKLQVASTESNEKPFFDVFAEERCTQDSSRSLIQFMADVDARCNLFDKYNADCSLEIMFLATLREHRKQKLATLLCQKSYELACNFTNITITALTVNDLGPKYSNMKSRSVTTKTPKICQAIWTSEGSQKIGNVLDFTVHLTVPLTEFVFKDKTYADRIGTIPCFCQVAAKVAEK